MIAWVEFGIAVAFITAMLWLLWTDMTVLHERAQHEALLDELWDSDDDLADSC